MSNKRLQDFLIADELVDYIEKVPTNRCMIFLLKKPFVRILFFIVSDDAIDMEDSTLTWDKEEPVPTLQDVNVSVSRGSLIAVVGKVGAGKSSLLYSLLGSFFLKILLKWIVVHGGSEVICLLVQRIFFVFPFPHIFSQRHTKALLYNYCKLFTQIFKL